MSDWASREAAKDAAAEQQDDLRLKKETRDADILEERGPAIFAELYEYIMSQVDSYNEQRGEKVLGVSISRQTPTTPQKFTVSRLDRTRQPLTVTYLRASHRIICESVAGPQEYILRIDPDGEARFETPYHQAFSIKELGDKILDHWKSSRI
jgi:hypothetical protein